MEQQSPFDHLYAHVLIQPLSLLTKVLDGCTVFLLILSFWVSYYLKVRRIKSIHETIVALFAGQ